MNHRGQRAVSPRVVVDSDVPRRKSSLSGAAVGWAAGVSTYLLIIAILQSPLWRNVPNIFFPFPLVILGIPIGVGFVAAWLRRTVDSRDMQRIALHSAKEAAIQEARTTTANVRATEESANDLIRELSQLLASVDRELILAASEYRQRAYAPFWDCVARATEHLATFRTRVYLLASLQQKYTKLLEGREHSFPKTLQLRNQIPQPRDLVVRLTNLAREAQRDFEFAVIWEHHKTRRVLVEGFSTLGAALGNLESSLTEALEHVAREFRDTLSDATIDLDSSMSEGRDQVLEGLERIEDELHRRGHRA